MRLDQSRGAQAGDQSVGGPQGDPKLLGEALDGEAAPWGAEEGEGCGQFGSGHAAEPTPCPPLSPWGRTAPQVLGACPQNLKTGDRYGPGLKVEFARLDPQQLADFTRSL